MRINFNYDGELKRRLEQYSPETDRALNQYCSSSEMHNLYDQNIEHREFYDLVDSLPNVPCDMLKTHGGIISNIVLPLKLDYDPKFDSIDRTLKSHFRKSRYYSNKELLDDFSVVLARSIPSFVLELLSNEPRTDLFGMRKNEIYHYLKIPRIKQYDLIFNS